MKPSFAIVLFLYRAQLYWYEEIALRQLAKVLGHYQIVAVVPEYERPAGMDLLPSNSLLCPVPGRCLASRASYNRLLMNPDFYAKFIGYEYILIHQLDAVVFADRVGDFICMEYDYIGAPWLAGELIQRYNFPFSVALNKLFPWINPRRLCYVGNGGLSLRRPRACVELLRTSGVVARIASLNEDGFFAWHGSANPDLFRVAPIEVAVDFAWENDASSCVTLNQNALPFGCHAWPITRCSVIRQLLEPILRDHHMLSTEVDEYLLHA